MGNNRQLLKKIAFIFLSFWVMVFEVHASDNEDEGSCRKRPKMEEAPFEESDVIHKVLFSLADFASEINIRMLSHVTPSELLVLQQVCKKFNYLIKNTPHLNYRKELHYGLHLGAIQGVHHQPVIKFSKNGNEGVLHLPMKVGGHGVSRVENLSLAKFKNRHYAAILRKEDLKSNLQILVCDDGISWDLVATIESGSLLDIQFLTFQEKLWLAYIPSATKTITLTVSSDGSEWKPSFETPLPKAKRLKMVDFQDQIYLAYTAFLDEEVSHDSLLQRTDTRRFDEDIAQENLLSRRDSVMRGVNTPDIPLFHTKRVTLAEMEEEIHITSSKDGNAWGPSSIWKTPRRMANSLQLVSYQEKLILAYIETNRRVIQVNSSENGVNWKQERDCKTLNMLEDIILYVFQGRMFLAYTCEGAGDSPLIFRLTENGEWAMLPRPPLLSADLSLTKGEGSYGDFQGTLKKN